MSFAEQVQKALEDARERAKQEIAEKVKAEQEAKRKAMAEVDACIPYAFEHAKSEILKAASNGESKIFCRVRNCGTNRQELVTLVASRIASGVADLLRKEGLKANAESRNEEDRYDDYSKSDLVYGVSVEL